MRSRSLARPAAHEAVHNLLVQRTALVGREQELNEATDLVMRESVRLVTLTGPGGIGKTRLAIELARRLLDKFRASH